MNEFCNIRDFIKPFLLTTDINNEFSKPSFPASNRLMVHASRIIYELEMNYSLIEKELFAIV